MVIALGSNVHVFARPHRRAELAQCFQTALGSPVRTIEFPGIDQPMLVVSFPSGGHLSIEFTDAAPDDEQPRLGAWLELPADDPAAAHRAALDAGLAEVRHPGHPYYFMIPGGPGTWTGSLPRALSGGCAITEAAPITSSAPRPSSRCSDRSSPA